MMVNDDGRARVYRGGLTMRDAEAMAGRMRDGSTEEEIAAGWNFLPRRTGGFEGRSNKQNHRTDVRGRCAPALPSRRDPGS